MKNLFILCFLLSTHLLYGQGTPVIYTSWEPGQGGRTVSGKLNMNTSGLACTPDCMEVMSTYARQGDSSIHSIITYPGVICGSSHRCEYLVTKSGSDTAVKNKYYQISTYFNTWPYDNKDLLIMQWYTTSYPVLAVWVRPDPSGLFMNYVLVIQYNATSPSLPLNTQKTIKLGQVQTGKWVDWAFEIDWQPNGTGYIDVYMNGVLQDKGGGHTDSGQNMQPFYNPLQPRYPVWRNGIYAFSWSTSAPAITTREAYYDVLQIGNADMTINDFLFNYNPPPTAEPKPVRVKVRGAN